MNQRDVIIDVAGVLAGEMVLSREYCTRLIGSFANRIALRSHKARALAKEGREHFDTIRGCYEKGNVGKKV